MMHDHWMVPCRAYVPKYAAGICMQLPAMFVAAIVIAVVAMLKLGETKKKKE